MTCHCLSKLPYNESIKKDTLQNSAVLQKDQNERQVFLRTL